MSGAPSSEVDPAPESNRVLEPSAWALVNRSLVDVMAAPQLAAERVSQAVVGEACRVRRCEGEWTELCLERDGYIGWVQSSALHRASAAEVFAYRAAVDSAVAAEIATAYHSSEQAVRVGKLAFGVSLPLVGTAYDRHALRLPDGRTWWLARADIVPNEAIHAGGGGVTRALALMQRSVGVPYAWGGCTPFGYDCSGLTQAFWSFLGTRIPRDADQQFQSGQVLEGTPEAGDLVFFSTGGGPEERPRHENVRHVGISLGGTELLHASGSERAVRVDRVELEAGARGAWLKQHLAGVRRFVPRCS